LGNPSLSHPSAVTEYLLFNDLIILLTLGSYIMEFADLTTAIFR
jgi:hypothetical protein